MNRKEKIRKKSPNILLGLLVCFCFIAFMYSCESDDKKSEKPEATVEPTAVSTTGEESESDTETVTAEQIKADSLMAEAIRVENSTWIMKLPAETLKLILKTENPSQSNLPRQLILKFVKMNGRWGLSVKSLSKTGGNESSYIDLVIIDTLESVPNINLLDRRKQRIRRGDLRYVFNQNAGTIPIPGGKIKDLYFKAAIDADPKIPGVMRLYYSTNLELLKAATFNDPPFTNPSPPKGDCLDNCDDPPQP